MQAERPRAALNAQLLRINEGYRSAGIARYILHLVRALPSVASDFHFDIFSTEQLTPSLVPNAAVHTTRFPAHKPLARIFWEQFILPFLLLQKNCDLLHSLAYVSPIAQTLPSVVTLYDLSFYLYPEYFRPFQRLYLQIGTRLSVKRAQRILTISAATKRDTVRLLGVDESKIDIAPPAVDPTFFQPVDPLVIENFRRAKNLPAHFVLFIGTREPRKNIPTLLRAFAILKRAEKIPHRLVLAGGRGWRDQEITRTLQATGLANEVLFPGFVPDAELPLWYRAADAFVYPSQYEGFGMPALEALASETPVITSNISSLPEAVGDAALLVNPQSPEQLADAMRRVLTDAALRHQLKTRGIAHAHKFSWTDTAQVTAQAYRHALDLAHPVPILPSRI